MRYCPWLVAVVVAVAGCADGTEEGSQYSSTQTQDAEVTSGLLYFYVSPLAPNSQGFGPLALRRANAKPGTLNPTYGAATIPEIRLAAGALTTQTALDAVIHTPYAGHENSVIAIIGGRSNSAPWENPRVDVVELYVPSQPVAINDAAGVTGVAQRDALYYLSVGGGKTTAHVLNESDYPATNTSAITFDYSATTNAPAATVAVQGGALFTGKVDPACKKILGLWTKCDSPTKVKVGAYFSAN